LNTATVQLAIFLRDLLMLSESVINIGRQNFNRNDFTSLQIVIDTIGGATRLSGNNTFDGVTEQIEYAQQWQAPCTINFYGDGAFQEATKFSLLIQSQAGYELQRDNGITVFESNALTDVRSLTGEQYSERYELGVNVQYTISAKVDTLRIDTAQTTIIED
jgi:hypothetical protein